MTPRGLTWGNGCIGLQVTWSETESPKIRRLGTGEPAPSIGHRDTLGQSLIELTVGAQGHDKFGGRYSETRVGRALRYVRHEESARDGWRVLSVTTEAPEHRVRAVVRYETPDGVAALRSIVTVTNTGPEPLRLRSVSSLSALVADRTHDLEDYDLLTARSDWLAESRWRVEPLRQHEMVDTNLGLHGGEGGLSDVIMAVGATVTRSSVGTRTTGHVLPTGGLVDRRGGRALLWQVEHNGSWLWQLGERMDGVYLAMLGPTDVEHQWSRTLAPGESFETVPAAVVVSDDGLDGAAAELTRYRRRIRRPHPDHTLLPVVFNDYMNTLMGDPTTDKLLPLIDAAADAGADYFCIDCGWYDDGGSWWDSVGLWQPSTTRFPGGLEKVMQHIVECGMTPGIWLEPEVVGVNSPAADLLPDSAFLQRDGERWRDHERYHLDLRSPEAVRHLDEVVDRLVARYGVGFFKLDYNITAGAGTDLDAGSAGDGLLRSNRAQLDWIDGVLDRHPTLVIESCSSGAMRMDYGILARTQLQSSSDQQDYRLYAAIAAATPLSLTPEQSGHWAYPQPAMDEEAVAFAMVNALVGRVYLSGYLNQMSPAQLRLVRDGVAIHKETRALVARAVPFWPGGLPQWGDGVVTLGLRDGNDGLLAVWDRRPGATETVVDLSHAPWAVGSADVLYPTGRRDVTWDAQHSLLRIGRTSAAPQATFLRLR